MMVLQISFLPFKEISPEQDRLIDELDRLAFADEDPNDPQLKGIKWSAPDWMALGYWGDQMVTQLGIQKRQIVVGNSITFVAGIGGVATNPTWQKKGLASRLLRSSETFMRDHLEVPFGLLICARETQPFYAGCGWQTVAQSLVYIQNKQQFSLDTCIMVLPLTGQSWPSGEINLCGLPW